TLRRFMAIAVACLIIAGVAGYIYWGPTQQQQQQRTRRDRNAQDVVPVLVATANLDDVPIYLDGVGTIKALNTVLVKSQADGQIVKIAFREGQDVSRGFVIAQIDPRTYQAQLDQAVAKKAQDEAQL